MGALHRYSKLAQSDETVNRHLPAIIKVHWIQIAILTIVAKFLGRGTGTRVEDHRVANNRERRGIHLLHDRSIGGMHPQQFGNDDPGTIRWVEERDPRWSFEMQRCIRMAKSP